MDLEKLKALLAARVDKCFLCAWLYKDLEANGKLTIYPGPAFDGSAPFPMEGKVKHLMLEGFWQVEMKAMVSEEVMKKVKAE